MTGTFSTFQKAMLRWNEMHPYNAVHVIRLEKALDRERLESAIHNEIETLGLGGLRIDRSRNSYTFGEGSEGIELRLLQAGNDPDALIEQEIEAELNRPFSLESPSPFRFFVLEQAGAFYLGLVYFHAMAGAEAIALLLLSIANRYLERGGSLFIPPIERYPRLPGLLSLVRPAHARAMLRLAAGNVRAIRNSCRLRFRSSEGEKNGYTAFPVSPEQFRRIAAAAKQWGVTLNDFFLAVILKSVEPLADSRLKASRRRLISAASIANIRRDLKIDAAKTFGLFLGSFSVSHEVPEAVSLKSLAQDIRQQTAEIKKYGTYLLFPLQLRAAAAAMPFFGGSRASRFYAKHYPLWAGITNMNLNGLGPVQGAEEIPAYYLRGVSTGPVTPCVFAVTTAGETLQVGLSYRTAAFNPSDIDGMKRRFRKILEDCGVQI